MATDLAGGAEAAAVGASLPSAENGKWLCRWTLEKRHTEDPDEVPYETVGGEGNLLLTAGVTAMLNLLTGAGGTAFNNANTYIGIGDSSTAASAGQTDLQGTLAATKTITGATNATPISVTATTHGYTTGDTITVAAVGGNTAANGTFVITVVDANTFTLNGSVGSGAYTSGGTAAKGNRFRKIMSATYPSVATNVVTLVAAYGPTEGNFAWNEFGVFNAISGGTMLNRAVSSLGTKTTGTYTFTVTITIS